jgi:Pentapeptide repeats (8 copies)
MRSMLTWPGRSPVSVAIASLVALLLACVLVFPALLVRMDFDGSAKGPLRQVQVLKARNDVRTTLLQGLGTLVAVAGIIVTLRANNQRGQATERFVSAVDQLGNDRLEVRIGGIYALERIATDSRDDHPTIMEILTGFVRGHSPWRPAHPAQEDWGAADTEAWPAMTPTDVQAAMTVVGRRNPAHDPAEMRLDLSAVDLRGLVLPIANLSGVSLQRANLERAMLDGAHLEHAYLAGAYLAGAHLEHAYLAGAYLAGANLAGANLAGANLAGARLDSANLQNALLGGALLHGASLREADLRQADLSGADLLEADLSGADLTGASYDERTVWPTGFTPPS